MTESLNVKQVSRVKSWSLESHSQGTLKLRYRQRVPHKCDLRKDTFRNSKMPRQLTLYPICSGPDRIKTRQTSCTDT